MPARKLSKLTRLQCMNSEKMDIPVADQESEHRTNLLEAIEDERRKCKILESERQELEFAMLRSTDIKMRKLDEFLSLNVWDPMLYLNGELEPQPDKDLLMNAVFDFFNIRVTNMSVTELEDKQQEYADSSYVGLIDVELHDPKQADDGQQFVEACLKENSIPLLLQGLLEYCNKVCQRAEFLQKIESQFSERVSVRESDDDGTLTILVNPAAKAKTNKLELKWGICYDAELVSFSFAFGFKCKSSCIGIQEHDT
ncbi:hypothetical protein B566_EDAN012466 [Ephemera danica]|nr:hypothetical protein B566_EDAN012466 [Ephemera danica]